MSETPKAPGYTVEELRRMLRKQTLKTRGGGEAPKPVAPPAERATGRRPIVYRRDLPRAGDAPRAGAVGPHVAIEDALAGHEILRTARGELFLVTTRVDELDGAASLDARFRACLERGTAAAVRIARACALDAPKVEDVLFMDVESTGLGCSPLFLIGIMLWRDGLEVRQYLARNYAEEAAVIEAFTGLCREHRLLITFNGKSFDFPFIRTRAAMTGVPFDIAPAHFDLLHACRRIWKDALPDCKLQTLEHRICGRKRAGDIPGADIPDAYHGFARTGNACEIVEILKHNLLDLVTLADLMTRFPPP